MNQGPATLGIRPAVEPDSDSDVLEFTGVSSTKQRRLADGWPRRHESR